jgi:hypothetical protein
MERARQQDSCNFRVFGDIGDPDRISALLGVEPTYTHRKGERRSKFTEPYSNDMWRYEISGDDEETLGDLLRQIHGVFLAKAEQIKSLVADEGLKVDVFCSYLFLPNQGGFDFSPQALELFTRAGIELCISIRD